MRRLQALSLCLVAVAVAALAGCGGGGAGSGATVSVYAAAPLCREARKGAGEAGDLEVRVVCLPPHGSREVDLAAVGAAARRATEDSTAVAFLEAPGPGAKFSRSIVEAAGIAWVETSSGSTAMRRILETLDGSPSAPRQAVSDEIG